MARRAEPTHHDVLVSDGAKLDAAIAEAAHSTAPLWHLAIAATRLIHLRRYEDALRIYDAIVPHRTIDPSAYCNALWVVQEENTRRPRELERAQRYLPLCLRHASVNPAIHLNASGALMELGDEEGALAQLFAAVHREVDIGEAIKAPLLAPLRAHARWRELEALLAGTQTFAQMLARAGAANVTEDGFDGMRLAGTVTAAQTVAALQFALDAEDRRLVHHALRHVAWWRTEPEYDWCFPNPKAVSEWHQAIEPLIAEELPLALLFERIAADLAGPWAHTAVHSFNIVCRTYAYDAGFSEGLATIAPQLAEIVRHGDLGIRDSLLDGLFWVTHPAATQAVVAAHLLEPIRDNLEVLSQTSLSDLETASRDQVRNSVRVFGDLGRVAELKPVLAHIVAKARGEVWDQHLRDELAKLIA